MAKSELEGCGFFFLLHDEVLNFFLHAVDPVHFLLVVFLEFGLLAKFLGLHMLELFIKLNMPRVKHHGLESESTCGN